MKNKRKVKFILPVLAVMVIAAAGIGYAYLAQTSIGENTTTETYMTLTPNGDVYSSHFTGEILYDTVNANGNITYSVSDDQIIPIYGIGDCIALGSVIIHVQQFGTVRDFSMAMSKVSGTTLGSFYTGFEESANGTSYADAGFTALGSDCEIDQNSEWVRITLYVGASFQTNNTIAQNVLTDAVFDIHATAVA